MNYLLLVFLCLFSFSSLYAENSRAAKGKIAKQEINNILPNIATLYEKQNMFQSALLTLLKIPTDQVDDKIEKRILRLYVLSGNLDLGLRRYIGKDPTELPLPALQAYISRLHSWGYTKQAETLLDATRAKWQDNWRFSMLALDIKIARRAHMEAFSLIEKFYKKKFKALPIDSARKADANDAEITATYFNYRREGCHNVHDAALYTITRASQMIACTMVGKQQEEMMKRCEALGIKDIRLYVLYRSAYHRLEDYERIPKFSSKLPLLGSEVLLKAMRYPWGYPNERATAEELTKIIDTLKKTNSPHAQTLEVFHKTKYLPNDEQIKKRFNYLLSLDQTPPWIYEFMKKDVAVDDEIVRIVRAGYLKAVRELITPNVVVSARDSGDQFIAVLQTYLQLNEQHLVPTMIEKLNARYITTKANITEETNAEFRDLPFRFKGMPKPALGYYRSSILHYGYKGMPMFIANCYADFSSNAGRIQHIIPNPKLIKNPLLRTILLQNQQTPKHKYIQKTTVTQDQALAIYLECNTPELKWDWFLLIGRNHHLLRHQNTQVLLSNLAVESEKMKSMINAFLVHYGTEKEVNKAMIRLLNDGTHLHFNCLENILKQNYPFDKNITDLIQLKIKKRNEQRVIQAKSRSNHYQLVHKINSYERTFGYHKLNDSQQVNSEAMIRVAYFLALKLKTDWINDATGYIKDKDAELTFLNEVEPKIGLKNAVKWYRYCMLAAKLDQHEKLKYGVKMLKQCDSTDPTINANLALWTSQDYEEINTALRLYSLNYNSGGYLTLLPTKNNPLDYTRIFHTLIKTSSDVSLPTRHSHNFLELALNHEKDPSRRDALHLSYGLYTGTILETLAGIPYKNVDLLEKLSLFPGRIIGRYGCHYRKNLYNFSESNRDNINKNHPRWILLKLEHIGVYHGMDALLTKLKKIDTESYTLTKLRRDLLQAKQGHLPAIIQTVLMEKHSVDIDHLKSIVQVLRYRKISLEIIHLPLQQWLLSQPPGAIALYGKEYAAIFQDLMGAIAADVLKSGNKQDITKFLHVLKKRTDQHLAGKNKEAWAFNYLVYPKEIKQEHLYPFMLCSYACCLDLFRENAEKLYKDCLIPQTAALCGAMSPHIFLRDQALLNAYYGLCKMNKTLKDFDPIVSKIFPFDNYLYSHKNRHINNQNYNTVLGYIRRNKGTPSKGFITDPRLKEIKDSTYRSMVPLLHQNKAVIEKLPKQQRMAIGNYALLNETNSRHFTESAEYKKEAKKFGIYHLFKE